MKLSKAVKNQIVFRTNFVGSTQCKIDTYTKQGTNKIRSI